MKSTQERLAESYCRPKTEEEWRLLKVSKHSFNGNHDAVIYGNSSALGWSVEKSEMNGYTEIPVSHFIDLMHDRLSPWRLEEDGFTTLGGPVYSKRFTIDSEDGKITRTITVITDTGRVYLNYGPANVSTYTDLLTLIRLIG